MTTAQRVDEFEALRPQLLAVAYRLTGTMADAEDLVQEAWLKWAAQPADSVADLRAWLTTVVGRLSLDRLRSAAHRRESYVGHWLPEPVVTALEGDDPLARVVAHEDARFAAMVVLERLTPDQRVAFVLHDGFAVPFGEIAPVCGRQRRRGPSVGVARPEGCGRRSCAGGRRFPRRGCRRPTRGDGLG